MKKHYFLNIIVAVTGASIIFLGLNIGLGGIRTLGWQVTQDFVSITDAVIFDVQDNHIRFIGGIWFGIGAIFLIGGLALDKLRPTLITLCFIIPVAGLFRLSALDSELIFNAAIAPSLALELIGFPLLALWLKRSGTKPKQY